jgi:hypothetical protein
MVARNLDLTSFQNSVGPRRRAGKKTPEDYGFIRIDQVGSLATMTEKDGSWEITVTLISNDGPDATICFTDTALNGGSYRAQAALTVHRDLRDGLYRALPDRPVVPSCPAKP